MWMGDNLGQEIVFEAAGMVSLNTSVYGGRKEKKERGDRKKDEGMGEEGMALRKGLGPCGSREQNEIHQPTLHVMPTRPYPGSRHTVSRGGRTAEADFKTHIQLLLKILHTVSLD